MSTDAKVTAIAPWYGGKRTLADEIVRELGPHVGFWDLCCGSMAVLFAKPESSHEFVNDLHGDLINLALVLRDEQLAVQLYDRAARTLYHEDLFHQSQSIYRAGDPGDEPNVDRAYHYLVVSWMGRNGVSGTARTNETFACRWTPGGGGGGVRWTAAVDSIPAWHRRLRRVSILRRDMFIVAEKIEDLAEVAIYVDPPYLIDGDTRSGGCRYKHEFQPEDHQRLADALSRFRNARVVVSYYDSPLLDDLYPSDQWTKRRLIAKKNLHVQNRRGAERTGFGPACSTTFRKAAGS